MSEAGDRSLFHVLTVGATVTGLAGAEPVKIVAIERLTDESANVAYRSETGAIVEKIVFADMLPHLKAVKAGSAFSFDGSPDAFLLAAEARRMRLAHLFDPLAALGTSDVDPLPHQLRAVYEEMLPRQPLRYVLADDPGAGKTIMAGLLIKELLLRGDAAERPGRRSRRPRGPVGRRDAGEVRDSSSQMLTRDKIHRRGGNPFARGGLWLARLDVLARNSEAILDKACEVDWDLVDLRRGPQDVRVGVRRRGQEDQAVPDGRGLGEAHAQPPADDRDAALRQGGAVPAVHGAARLRPVRGRRSRGHPQGRRVGPDAPPGQGGAPHASTAPGCSPSASPTRCSTS